MRISCFRMRGVAVLLACVVFAGFSAVLSAEADTAPDALSQRTLRKPRHPSSEAPDNIVLTPGETATRMTVNWRTSAFVKNGVVQYHPVGSDADAPLEAQAEMRRLNFDDFTYNRLVNCYSAVMDNLAPDSRYRYRVGSPENDEWSEWVEFSTGVDKGRDFTFAYLGDTQQDSAAVGEMLRSVDARHPDAKFYLIGGDLVEKGERRDYWDAFLLHTTAVFSRKPLFPALGNHDVDNERDAFSHYFTLPDNGLAGTEECKNYYFVQGDVFFVVLDSNYPKPPQKEWLEDVLEMADGKGYAFKVAMFHQPAYNPRKGRDGKSVRREWVPTLEEYGVDLVLTGHDHSYARTYPVRNDAPAKEGESGTIYLVATSCQKFYENEPIPNAAVQYADLATYQVITVKTGDDGVPVMQFNAYDWDGEPVDSFRIVGKREGERGRVKRRSARKQGASPWNSPEAAETLALLAGIGRAQMDGGNVPGIQAGNGAIANGRLRVDGVQLVNQRGEPIQLRGMSSHGIHWFPDFLNIRALLDVKMRGANLFRVAMYADSNKNGYNNNSRDRNLNKRLLRLAVENSRAADMYTIIDWHLLEDQNPLKQVRHAVKFFDEMSRLYANDPGIIYEICNEPNGDTTWEDVRAYAEKVIPVIRKNSPNAVILVGTPNYCVDIFRAQESPLGYDNIMYTFHLYTGFSNYGYVRALDSARADGLPVFVSEWGISKENDGDEFKLEKGYDFLEYMHKHKLSWAYWSLCNDDRDYVVIDKEVTKLSGWGDEDLTTPGKIIFSALKDGLPRREEEGQSIVNSK